MTSDLTFWDSSGIVKTLVSERGTEFAMSLFSDRSRTVITSELTYVEIASALARRLRNRELTEEQTQAALDLLDWRWSSLSPVQVSRHIIRDAARLALQFSLSGADAVQVASAQAAGATSSVTFVTWDRRQAVAARALGFDVQPSLD